MATEKPVKASRAVAVAAAAVVLAMGAADASAAVYVKGSYGGFKQAPAKLTLWASDGMVNLRWRQWGAGVAFGSGEITQHGRETGYRRVLVPARVELSGIGRCGGRRVYLAVRYRIWNGPWQRGSATGDCRLQP